jgi:hypothetical protein
MLKNLGTVRGYLSYLRLTGGSKSVIENICTGTVLVTGYLISDSHCSIKINMESSLDGII